MKKVFLLLTATAIMLAVGVYSLVDTKNVVGLMTLSDDFITKPERERALSKGCSSELPFTTISVLP